VRRHRARDSAYQRNLGFIIVASAATTLLAVLSWSAWAAVAPRGVHLLLGLDSRIWLAVVFGLGTIGAVVCLTGATFALIQFRRDARGAAKWDP